MSPFLDEPRLTARDGSPTPPHHDALNDIYGSAPSSPILSSHNLLPSTRSSTRAYEILSDLPSRQRALDTDAYREGLAHSKGQFVQEGFDEGYSLGANLGLQVGYILGLLRGFVATLDNLDRPERVEVREMYQAAQKELAIEELLGKKWVDEEGIWKWEVKSEGEGEDATFREVAGQHPVMGKWMGEVEDLAMRWHVDLKAVDEAHVPQDETS